MIIKHNGNIEVTDGVITVDGNPIAGATGPQGFDGGTGLTGLDGPNGVMGPISGTNYKIVTATGTPTENAAELQAAYDAAKLMSPSPTNRITLVVTPGHYHFPENIPGYGFIMDTDYIDIVSLDGNSSIIYSADNGAIMSLYYINTFVKGIRTDSCSIDTAGPNVRLENCIANNFTGVGDGIYINCTGGGFFADANAPGTFINCTAYGRGFGYTESIGFFMNCHALGLQFGFGSSSALGTYINCTAGDFSLGSNFATGTFVNCTGGEYSFGSGVDASGTFTNCTGGEYSFGGYTGTLTGKLYYCRLTSGTFPTVSSGGRTYYCVDGNGNTNNQ